MLTCVGVGVEGESAVLDVEGEGVDVQSAGANHSDRTVVIDLAIRIDMYIRHKWGCVFRNAVGRQKKHFTLEISIIILYQRPCIAYKGSPCNHFYLEIRLVKGVTVI